MTFSRSFKGRVEIIHFYAMFRNMNQILHIEINLKIMSMYTCSSQVLLLYHELFKLRKYVKFGDFGVIFVKPSESRFKAKDILIPND